MADFGLSTAKSKTQLVHAMATAVVTADPLLRYQLKSIVQGALDHMAQTMAHGTADSKMALTKSLMPHLLSGLQAAESTDSDRAKAETYDRMMKFMRGEITLEEYGPQPDTQSEPKAS